MRLFLLLLILSTPALAQIVTTDPQSIVINPVPAFAVEVFVDKDTSGSAAPNYVIGEAISIGVRVAEASYVYLYNVRNTGEVRQLIPNRYDADGQNNYLQAGETKYFPPYNARYTFNVDGPEGLDKVIAIASKNPLDTRQLADFSSDPSFATSNIGQDGFAQTFSIVITPIPQNEWVTDTAVFYVGSGYVEPQPIPTPSPSVVLFNYPYLLAYPGSSVTYLENGSRQQEAEFETAPDLREVYRHFNDQLIQVGWQRLGLEAKNNRIQASYQFNGEYLEFELKQLGSSGKYRLELLSL